MARINGAGMNGAGTHGAGLGAGAMAPGGAFSPLARAQYAALLSMRWSMFRNGMRSIVGAMEVGARVVSTIVYGGMGLGLSVGLGTGAYQLISHGQWRFVPLLLWAVFVLWQMVPITVASFQEQFEMGGLLRFPVGFGSFYLLHLVFGLIDISTIMGGLCCLGIWIGTVLARPDLAGWMALALLVFAAFNVLLVRAIFAWIDRWLAQRRTREIVTGLFLLGILAVNLVNPAFRQQKNMHMNAQTQAQGMQALRKANALQRWLPPGLAAQVVTHGAHGAAGTSLEMLALLGVYAVGSGGALGWRLRAEFRGESLSEAPSRKKAERRQGAWLLDGSGPIAAVMEKEARTLMRAMPLLYGLLMPLVMVFIFQGLFRGGSARQGPQVSWGMLICLAYAVLGFTQLIYNNLGAEGPNIQMLFLSPTPMRTVMLGKNLFHALLFGVDAVLVCVLVAWRYGVPDPLVVAATWAWVLFALPVHLAVGNVLSIQMAYRVRLGRLGRQKGAQANALVSMLSQAVVLGLGAGILALCALNGRLWLAIPILLVLAAGAVVGWLQVLVHVDAMAYGRREELMATLVRTE